MDYNELYRMIGSECHDPAQRERHAHLLRTFAPALVEALMVQRAAVIAQAPFPALDKIRAAQCSIFDNLIGKATLDRHGRKLRAPRRSRYGISIDVWTADPDRTQLSKLNRTFTATGALMNAVQLDARFAELEKPSKCRRPFVACHDGDVEGATLAAYAAFLRHTSSEQSDFDFAPLFTKKPGEGSFYHADTFAFMQRSAIGADVLRISSPAGIFNFDGFSPTDSKGIRLAGNCIAQSRMATSTTYAKRWKAQNLPFSN